MTYYIQLDKNNKVISYSSLRVSNNDIEIDSNMNYKELLINPFIFKFDELNNTFIKDIEYQNKLIKENRLTYDKKINKLTNELAKTKIDIMQKDTLISMLIKEQAKNRIEKMKAGA